MTPATTHPLNAPARVRPPQQRVAPHDLDVATKSAAAMQAATDRLLDNLTDVTTAKAAAHIKQGRCASLAMRGDTSLSRLACHLIAIANAGATEAECMAPVTYLIGVVADCYPARVRRSLDVLDVEEQRHDGEEDCAQTVRRIAPTAATLRAELDCVRRLNAVNNERERVLAAELRRAELAEGNVPTVPARVTVVVGGLR